MSTDETRSGASPAPAEASPAPCPPSSGLHVQGEAGRGRQRPQVLPGGEGRPDGQVTPAERSDTTLSLPPPARPRQPPTQPASSPRPADTVGPDGAAAPAQLRPAGPVTPTLGSLHLLLPAE